MKTQSKSQIGGVGAVGVTFFTGLFFIFLVLAHRMGGSQEDILWPHVLADYALALIGLCGLAAVPAITARVAAADRELARWSSVLAQLGFGLLAVLSFWQAEYETTLAAEASIGGLPAFPEAGASLIDALLTRLPQGWLETAGVGIWLIVVGRLAQQHRLLPAGLVWLGYVAGAAGILTALGAALQWTAVAPAAQVLFCTVLAPSWFFWSGSVLLDAAAPAPVKAPHVLVQEMPLPARRRNGLVPTLRRWADRVPSLN